MPSYHVGLSPTAERALRRFPIQFQHRITGALETLEVDPRRPGTLKLAGHEILWRIRIGRYRAIYSIDDDRLIVLVVRIAHRKDAYRGL